MTQYYRKIEEGEPGKAGDLYPNNLYVDLRMKSLKLDGGPWSPGYDAFRPVDGVDEWISIKDKIKYRERYNEYVHAHYDDGSQRIARLGDVATASYFRFITPPTPVEKPILIGKDNHKVVFNKDGSIQVGCTPVSAEQLDEIIKRRNATIKK